MIRKHANFTLVINFVSIDRIFLYSYFLLTDYVLRSLVYKYSNSSRVPDHLVSGNIVYCYPASLRSDRSFLAFYFFNLPLNSPSLLRRGTLHTDLSLLNQGRGWLKEPFISAQPQAWQVFNILSFDSKHTTFLTIISVC